MSGPLQTWTLGSRYVTKCSAAARSLDSSVSVPAFDAPLALERDLEPEPIATERRVAGTLFTMINAAILRDGHARRRLHCPIIRQRVTAGNPSPKHTAITACSCDPFWNESIHERLAESGRLRLTRS
jgi:hypothetical protein